MSPTVLYCFRLISVSKYCGHLPYFCYLVTFLATRCAPDELLIVDSDTLTLGLLFFCLTTYIVRHPIVNRPRIIRFSSGFGCWRTILEPLRIPFVVPEQLRLRSGIRVWLSVCQHAAMAILFYCRILLP